MGVSIVPTTIFLSIMGCMSVFDGIQGIVFDACNDTFGSTVTWVKDSEHTYTAGCLYKDVNGTQKLGKETYSVDAISIEVRPEQFPGLLDLIARNGKPVLSVTTVSGTTEYIGHKTAGKSDGEIVKVNLKVKAGV